MQLTPKFQIAAEKPVEAENCPNKHEDNFNCFSCSDYNDQRGKHPVRRRALQRRNYLAVAEKVAAKGQSSLSCSEFSEESDQFQTENLSRPSSGCAPVNEQTCSTADTGHISRQCNTPSNPTNSIKLFHNFVDKCREGDRAMDNAPNDGLCYGNNLDDDLHCDPSVALTCNYKPGPGDEDLTEASNITTFCPISASTPCSRRTIGRSTDILQPLVVSCVLNEDKTALSVTSDSNRSLEEMTVLAKDTPSHLYSCGMFCSTRGYCNHSHK